jgi:hypothetical protein
MVVGWIQEAKKKVAGHKFLVGGKFSWPTLTQPIPTTTKEGWDAWCRDGDGLATSHVLLHVTMVGSSWSRFDPRSFGWGLSWGSQDLLHSGAQHCGAHKETPRPNAVVSGL